MKIEKQRYNRIIVLGLQGEFTHESVKSFDDAISSTLAEDTDGVVLDMSKVILLDSVSLESLVTVNEHCRERAQQLKLVGLDETCRKILEITRLYSQFDTYGELTEAVKSFV